MWIGFLYQNAVRSTNFIQEVHNRQVQFSFSYIEHYRLLLMEYIIRFYWNTWNWFCDVIPITHYWIASHVNWNTSHCDCWVWAGLNNSRYSESVHWSYDWKLIIDVIHITVINKSHHMFIGTYIFFFLATVQFMEA